ncbi:hypothetical protein [Rhodococcus sp. ARC_M6]|nr:hypothetical protein [Rhodococcus sp. ARC_M6]
MFVHRDTTGTRTDAVSPVVGNVRIVDRVEFAETVMFAAVAFSRY